MADGLAATELDEVRRAIDGLELPVDGTTIVAALRARDRLEAHIFEAVARFDVAELWDLDGATSMSRWLVAEAGMSDGAARRLVRTAVRLRELPAVAEAHATGALSSGQVELLVQKLRPRHVTLFARHEHELVPLLGHLDLAGTATAMDDWVARADAVLDATEEPEPASSRLHLAEVGDRGRLDADLLADDLAVVAEALRLARRPDDDSDLRRRTRAERDADALVDICRRVLRDHRTPVGAPGRQRPGVNVVIDAPALAALQLRELGIATMAELDDWLEARPTTLAERAWYRSGLSARHHGGTGGTTLSGHDLSPALTAAFCCDATMRRIVSAGSTILDYGRAMPTLPRSVREAVVLRDRRCRFRGCDRRVDWCEVHHLRHRADGGPDAVVNCVLLCARHHHVLHRDGWSAALAADGALTVTDPRGRRWTTRPPGPGNRPPPSNRLAFGA